MRTTSHGRGARSAKNAAANIRRPKTDGKETATQDFSESGQQFRRADVPPSPRRRAEAYLRRTTQPPQGPSTTSLPAGDRTCHISHSRRLQTNLPSSSPLGESGYRIPRLLAAHSRAHRSLGVLSWTTPASSPFPPPTSCRGI